MPCSRSETGKRPAADQKIDLKVTWIASLNRHLDLERIRAFGTRF